MLVDFAPGLALTSGANAPTVLIVDDEVLLCMVAADYLRDAGYRIIQAATGDEALEILQMVEHVDAVFTDIQMPGSIDGIGLVQWIRRERPHLYVVVTSGGMRPEEVWAKIGTATDFVSKPYNLLEVGGRIADGIAVQRAL